MFYEFNAIVYLLEKIMFTIKKMQKYFFSYFYQNILKHEICEIRVISLVSRLSQISMINIIATLLTGCVTYLYLV